MPTSCQLKLSSQNLRSDNSAKKPMNIEYVVKNGLCVGCGACEAACPNGAIKILFDIRQGMPFAKVNEERCSRCQSCLDVCYGYAVDQKLHIRFFGTLLKSVVGNSKRCYIGYANNELLRYSATSGGLVTAVLLYALEQGLIEGAIVTRMEAGNLPRAKAFIATTTKEIVSAKGSKYCPVSFAECLRSLKNGKRYAVVGLPCHIYGIRKLAGLNARTRNSVSLYLGLFCGGMPSNLGTLYVLRRYNMEREYITKFEYRGGGWPGRLFIQSKRHTSNRQAEIRVPYPKYWHGAYQFFFPYRCTLCLDGFNELADMSIGDAWLPHLTRKDKKGSSLIITRTKTGEHLVQESSKKGYVQLHSINIQEVTNSQPGLVRFKLSTLRARINLYKALRKKLPVFDFSITSSAEFDDYLSAIGLCLGSKLASSRDLWWLFDIYVSLYSLLKYTLLLKY